MLKSKTTVTKNRSRELLKQAQQGAAELNRQTAEEGAKIAKGLVPVQTGALRDSIHVEADKRTGVAVLVAGNEQVQYAAIIELGGIHRAPHPFLFPAMEQARKRMAHLAQRIRFYKG
jgi:HK97 gp10 family phage protein